MEGVEGGDPGPRPGAERPRPKIYTVRAGSQPYTGPFGREGTTVAEPPLEDDITIQVLSKQGRSVYGRVLTRDGQPVEDGPNKWFVFKRGKERGFM